MTHTEDGVPEKYALDNARENETKPRCGWAGSRPSTTTRRSGNPKAETTRMDHLEHLIEVYRAQPTARS